MKSLIVLILLGVCGPTSFATELKDLFEQGEFFKTIDTNKGFDPKTEYRLKYNIDTQPAAAAATWGLGRLETSYDRPGGKMIRVSEYYAEGLGADWTTLELDSRGSLVSFTKCSWSNSSGPSPEETGSSQCATVTPLACQKKKTPASIRSLSSTKEYQAAHERNMSELERINKLYKEENPLPKIHSKDPALLSATLAQYSVLCRKLNHLALVPTIPQGGGTEVLFQSTQKTIPAK